MSTDPRTSARVAIQTSIGAIDLQLWTKESPKACKRFLRTALEGGYDSGAFHRVVPGFLVQASPSADYEVEKSSVPVEKHSRLKFSRRGIVAMAGVGDQFFITLAPTPELLGKHTIVGKVVGDSLFKVVKIGEANLDGETPIQPVKIVRVDVLEHSFDDLRGVVRKEKAEKIEEREGKKKKKKVIKNLSVLSFGDDEDVEVEHGGVVQSSHDVLKGKDKKLKAQTVEEFEQEASKDVVKEDVVRVEEKEERIDDEEIVESEERTFDSAEEMETRVQNADEFPSESEAKAGKEQIQAQMDYESMKRELLRMKRSHNESESSQDLNKESALEQRRKKYLKQKIVDKSIRQDSVSL
jgi:peptidyl-prolyl cis-trans isomerase SDCCAG10